MRVAGEQWSPAQIVGWLRKHGKDSVCVETIYAYIRADKQKSQRKKKQKKRYFARFVLESCMFRFRDLRNMDIKIRNENILSSFRS